MTPLVPETKSFSIFLTNDVLSNHLISFCMCFTIGRLMICDCGTSLEKLIGRLRKSGGQKVDLISILLNKFS